MLRRSKRVWKSAVEAASNTVARALEKAFASVGLDYVIDMLGIDDDDDVPESEYIPIGNAEEHASHELKDFAMRCLIEARGAGKKPEA